MTRPTLLATIDQLTANASRSKRREERYLQKHPDSESAKRAIARCQGELETLALIRRIVPNRTEISYGRTKR